MQIQKPRQGYKLVKSSFGNYEEIPEEWALSKIEKFLQINMGQSPPSSNYNTDGVGLPFFQGVTDFGDLYPKPTIWCSDARKIAESDQILFSVRAPVGEINLTNSRCCIGRGIASLEVLNADIKYCFHLLKHFKNNFVKYSQGTTYDAINRDEIGKTKLIYTSNISEQQKIASILSNVDSLIQHTQKEIDQTQRLKKGLMQKLLTKGIGYTKFKETKFGKIANEWEIDSIEHLADIVTIGVVNAATPYYTTKDKGLPYFRSQNVRENFLNESNLVYVQPEFNKIHPKSILKENDVLTVQTGVKTGMSCLVTKKYEDCNCHSLLITRTNNKRLNPVYLCQFLNSDFGKKIISSLFMQANRDHLLLEDFRNLKIPIPLFEEQVKIVHIISNMDSKIQINEEYKSKLENLKKGLMQKLLTGQIRMKV